MELIMMKIFILLRNQPGLETNLNVNSCVSVYSPAAGY